MKKIIVNLTDEDVEMIDAIMTYENQRLPEGEPKWTAESVVQLAFVAFAKDWLEEIKALKKNDEYEDVNCNG